MARRVSLAGFVVAGLLAAVLLVVVLAPRASSSPDGLEKVAADEGFEADARDHGLGDSPFADYGVAGVDDAALGTVVAGVLGIAVTFGVCVGAAWSFRRRRDRPPPSAAPVPPPPQG